MPLVGAELGLSVEKGLHLDHIEHALRSGDLRALENVYAQNQEALVTWRLFDQSALHVAAKNGHTRVCQFMLDIGMDINIAIHKFNNNTPLADAAAKGHMETVEFLLSRGASIDGRPDTACTPLMAAIINGHADVVQYLLDAGADINREHLNLPRTPLDLAMVWDSVNQPEDRMMIPEFLKKRGAKHLQGWNYYGTLLSPPISQNEVAEKDYLHHIERSVGELSVTQIGEEGQDKVILRFARVRPQLKQKLLFTTGLASRLGFELAICLTAEWPVNRDVMQGKIREYYWPIGLLQSLSLAVQNGLNIEHGSIVPIDTLALSECGIPKGKTILVSRNDSIEFDRVESHDNLPGTFLLHLVSPLKRGITVTWADSTADRKSKATWKSLAHISDNVSGNR